MKQFIIVMLLAATMLYGAKKVDEKTYVHDFHEIIEDVCKSSKDIYLNEMGDYLLSLEEKHHIINICNYVKKCSQIKYTEYAKKCYENKVSMFDCVDSQKVIRSCTWEE